MRDARYDDDIARSAQHICVTRYERVRVYHFEARCLSSIFIDDRDNIMRALRRGVTRNILTNDAPRAADI